MDKDAFLSMLQDVLQRGEPVAMDMPLADIPEWDSLTAMLTLALAKQHFGKDLKIADFKKTVLVEDLYALLTQP
jgi:Phosphopantetheine attachment site.